ncbi:hypothetical protein [Ferrimonas lipolytica]|uniref:Uncharacterized protein n=1 Tax=Ferrimonas lipolytica TaxID=2724191 RepID=A0A6H1UB42_9GAMM|nr:hypothetical protein [Ferrimonas lipolytica]QIZ75859.1 hypothetical protein HER31_02560 [Ferrimonas lipolytica]
MVGNLCHLSNQFSDGIVTVVSCGQSKRVEMNAARLMLSVASIDAR